MNYLIRYNPWLEKAEHWLRGKDIAILRLSVFAVFAVFGVHGGSYFLGTAETATFILLIMGFRLPLAGIAAALMVLTTGFVTLSLMFQTGMVDSFIFKDVLLIGVGLVILRHDLLSHLSETANTVKVTQ